MSLLNSELIYCFLTNGHWAQKLISVTIALVPKLNYWPVDDKFVLVSTFWVNTLTDRHFLYSFVFFYLDHLLIEIITMGSNEQLMLLMQLHHLLMIGSESLLEVLLVFSYFLIDLYLVISKLVLNLGCLVIQIPYLLFILWIRLLIYQNFSIQFIYLVIEFLHLLLEAVWFCKRDLILLWGFLLHNSLLLNHHLLTYLQFMFLVSVHFFCLLLIIHLIQL